jgi:DNA-binding GntR family transcriptional regulator
MADRRRNGMPAYQKIQRAIRQRIESKQLKPGDAVSSERELARIHTVSLMTARHALAGLEREGIVERRRGAGTFVAPPRIQFNKLMSYTEQMASRGLAPSSKVIAAKLVEDEQEIAATVSLARPVAWSRSSAHGLPRRTLCPETRYLPGRRVCRACGAPLGRGSCSPRSSTTTASNCLRGRRG